MTLAPGSRLGPYEILARLGAGGMGEVVRARDPRLGREVAIKTLPAAFARDPERVARFEREAKLLASLNHPNIGALYGLEESQGQRYLILELIDGETLASRLARGAPPLDETLEIARQIAAALESAHENGVVHRDLKPGNVMITRDGVVKVLDFGLAKAGTASATSTDHVLSASPTMSYEATGAGTILGTAAYMSPEQARGKGVDRRTDIWSFGCVLFECLTGKAAFAGETVSDLIAQILRSEPEWSLLPADTPDRMRRLLARCLEKDPRRRLRDIGEARVTLDDLVTGGPTSDATSSHPALGPQARPAAPSPWRLAAFVLGAALLGSLVTLFVAPTTRHATTPGLVRFDVSATDAMQLDGEPSEQALSPDGSTLAFVVDDSTTTSIWVRPMDADASTRLAGTEGATLPFWSPDSKHIGFFTAHQLKRIDAVGGPVDELCPITSGRGGSWGTRGQIVFVRDANGPLFAVAENGGEARQVSVVDTTKHEIGHRFPCFLPDGRHFLFAVMPAVEDRYDVELGSLDEPGHEKLLRASSGAVYAAPGELVFLRGSELVAQPFDASSRRLGGDALPLHEWAEPSSYSGAAGVSVSETGAMSFHTLRSPDARIVWEERKTHRSTVSPIPPGPYRSFDLSSDNRHVALVRVVRGDESIWIGDLERGTVARLTPENEPCNSPYWSPDGTRIAYIRQTMIVVRAADGGGTPLALLADDPLLKVVTGWSPDGKFLLVQRLDPGSGWNLYRLPLDGDHRLVPFLVEPGDQTNFSVSHDGKWASYTAGSDPPQTFVTTYPEAGSRLQVSTSGAAFSAWGQWGDELLFGTPSVVLQVHSATMEAGPGMHVSPPREFTTLPQSAQWAGISSTGDRMIYLESVGKPLPSSITVLIGWRAKLSHVR